MLDLRTTRWLAKPLSKSLPILPHNNMYYTNLPRGWENNTDGQAKQHFSCIYAQATYETVLITTSNIANPTPTPRPKSTPRKIVAKHTTIHINYALRKKSLLNVNMWVNTTIVCTSNVAYLIVYITCLEKQRSLKFTETIKWTLLHQFCRFNRSYKQGFF